MADRNSLRVGLVQMAPQLNDVAANVQKHLAQMMAAREQDVDVLLFPELSLTGYAIGPFMPAIARPVTDTAVQQIARASTGMVTIVGLVEEGAGAQFYNTAVALRDGEIIFRHRKIYLPTYGRLEEGKHFAAGRQIELLALGQWQAGLLICADVWHPPLVHLAACRGATALFVPANSALGTVGDDFSNPDGWDLTLRYLAMTYGLPVVLVNRVGQEGDLRFWGGSRVVDPFGQVVMQAGEAEEVVTAVLNYNQVRRARYRLPTIRDTHLDLGQTGFTTSGIFKPPE